MFAILRGRDWTLIGVACVCQNNNINNYLRARVDITLNDGRVLIILGGRSDLILWVLLSDTGQQISKSHHQSFATKDVTATKTFFDK